MKTLLQNTLLLLLVVSFTACNNGINSVEEESPHATEVKNIIFLIGDGMGVNQLFSAIDESEDKLAMEKADYSGFSKTNSLSHKITDSAAGGTALATGKKTKNGVLGQDTSGTVFKTILEYAEDNGLSTGLVSTSSITHATPASFIAHQSSRNMYEAIAADFLKTEIDVFIGGGYNHFAGRSDGVNLVDSLRAKDYFIARNIEEVVSAEATKLAGLLAEVHLPSTLDGRDDMLPMATSKAIEILSKNDKGFFLMVEGSQIDWGGHANDYQYVLSETLDFDKAVEVAVQFAEKTPGTLVVVTSDHETGGLTLPSKEDDYTITAPNFATGGHSASLVPVFSYGDGAEKFSGILDNTDFFPRFMELYGFEKE